MGLLSKFLPGDTKFFPLFRQVAANFRDAIVVLEEFAQSGRGEARLNLARRMAEVEHRNDAVTHRIFDELHKNFITPFDREDIHQLASAADDVLDYLDSAVERCDILGVDELTPHMKQQFVILGKCMALIAEMLDSLGQMNGRQSGFGAKVRELHALENDADDTYMRALKELFDNPTDPIHVIRWNDLYRTIERAIDRCEGVGNVTEGVAIKNA